MNEFIESEFIENEVKKNIDKYGDVPPPWSFRPQSHPYSFQWRMGAGETYIMVYSAWLNKYCTSRDELIKFFNKYPPPPRWLGNVACTIWNLEPMEESFDYSEYFIQLKKFGIEGTENYIEDLSNEKWLD